MSSTKLVRQRNGEGKLTNSVLLDINEKDLLKTILGVEFMSRKIENRGTNGPQQKVDQSSLRHGGGQHNTGEDFYDMISDVSNSMSDYCAKRPKAAALALISVGFFLGWKIKPW